MTDDDDTEYGVVISEDGRWSIWPTFSAPPWGWAWEGFRGPRDACLSHVEAHWTDMRPLAPAGDGGA